MPYFTTITQERKVGRPHDLWWVGTALAKSLVKHNGSWRVVVAMTEEFMAECTVVLRGGYLNEISDELAAELTAAGYGDYITN